MSRYRFRDSEISADSWDRLGAASIDGTLFHTRRFLSYHRDRFADGERLLDISKGDTVKIVGKFWKEKSYFFYKIKNVIKARTVDVI